MLTSKSSSLFTGLCTLSSSFSCTSRHQLTIFLSAFCVWMKLEGGLRCGVELEVPVGFNVGLSFCLHEVLSSFVIWCCTPTIFSANLSFGTSTSWALWYHLMMTWSHLQASAYGHVFIIPYADCWTGPYFEPAACLCSKMKCQGAGSHWFFWLSYLFASKLLDIQLHDLLLINNALWGFDSIVWK